MAQELKVVPASCSRLGLLCVEPDEPGEAFGREPQTA